MTLTCVASSVWAMLRTQGRSRCASAAQARSRSLCPGMMARPAKTAPRMCGRDSTTRQMLHHRCRALAAFAQLFKTARPKTRVPVAHSRSTATRTPRQPATRAPAPHLRSGHGTVTAAQPRPIGSRCQSALHILHLLRPATNSPPAPHSRYASMQLPSAALLTSCRLAAASSLAALCSPAAPPAH
jgi:hypothetical protein